MAGQLETMTHRVERLERRLREERRSRRSVRGTNTSGSRMRVEGRWSPSPVKTDRAGPSRRVEIQNLTGFVGDGSEDRPFQLVEVEQVRRSPEYSAHDPWAIRYRTVPYGPWVIPYGIMISPWPMERTVLPNTIVSP
jgi:hypothetical protein